MTQQRSGKNPARLREAAIRLYQMGYTEGEIIRYKERLAEVEKLGSAWGALNQSTLNRWVNSAKEEDSDLEIWHLLNRRKRKPGVYTNWKPEGVIVLGPYYDQLTDTLYLGPGMDFDPTGGKGKKSQTASRWKMPDSDAVGPYVAELASLGYSLRDIVVLWKGGKTRRPDMDRAPRVQWLAKQLRSVREEPMSYTTVGRILRTYSYVRQTGQTTEEV